MHYANGRPAKDGDKVVNLTYGFSGILHSTNAQSSSCNGRIAAINQNDPYVTVGECLHVDDVKEAAKTLPDTTNRAEPQPA